jgi:cyclopropane fatty-acyl-phospholipid synthase-like methyltransferase
MDVTAKEIWEKEYQIKDLPTSHTQLPSHGIEYFINYLRIHQISLRGKLLDLGCGSGRNGVYLAKLGFEVVGMDFAENALNNFRARIEAERLKERIKLVCHSMDKSWPLDSEGFDFVTCLTSIENLLSDEQISLFKDEVHRVLRSSGYFFLYFLTEEDEFYGGLLEKSGKSNGTVFVSGIGLNQRVFTERELRQTFNGLLTVCETKIFDFEDVMYGKKYRRTLEGIIFQKI